MTKMAGSRSISQRHGSADPDPHQNVMDPEHWFQITKNKTTFHQFIHYADFYQDKCRTELDPALQKEHPAIP
jgi:hypothetical protein